MTADTIYQYADGSGNRYTLRGNTLTYDPVTPTESSTGTYSGGEPKSVTLTAQQVKLIIRVLEEATKKTSDHIENREKGTGLITIITGNKQQHCIVRRGSNTIAEIESLLKQHLK
ncbi:MAG: hypothetical protein HRU69_11630 [Flammeovirgaceae bacterium]|nr:MAG: hypothetical protein HRU69_11630 [Flammeovirgaceae bacterium]